MMATFFLISEPHLTSDSKSALMLDTIHINKHASLKSPTPEYDKYFYVCSHFPLNARMLHGAPNTKYDICNSFTSKSSTALYALTGTFGEHHNHSQHRHRCMHAQQHRSNTHRHSASHILADLDNLFFYQPLIQRWVILQHALRKTCWIQLGPQLTSHAMTIMLSGKHAMHMKSDSPSRLHVWKLSDSILSRMRTTSQL